MDDKSILIIELNKDGINLNLTQESKEPNIIINVGEKETKVTVNFKILFSGDRSIEEGDTIRYNTISAPKTPILANGDDGGEDSETLHYIESLSLPRDTFIYEKAFINGHHIYLAVLKIMEKLTIGPHCECVEDMIDNESLVYYGLLFQSFHPVIKYMEDPLTVFYKTMAIASNHATHYLSTKALSDNDRKLIKEYHRKYFLLLANDYRWQIASHKFEQFAMMEHLCLNKFHMF